jgi:hypothetical protein
MDVGEEVSESRKRQLPLSLGRPRDEHAESAFTPAVDTLQPERRLANPRLAFEHECGSGTVRQELVDPLELLHSTDQVPLISCHWHHDGTTGSTCQPARAQKVAGSTISSRGDACVR